VAAMKCSYNRRMYSTLGRRLGTLRPHRQLVATVAVVVLIGIVGCGASVDKAGGRKDQHPVVLHVLNIPALLELQPFVDMVSAVSKGALQLTLDNKSVRDTASEPDTVRAMQAGKADLAIVPARAFHALGVTSFDALIAPLAVGSMALQQKVLESEMPSQMLAGLKALDLDGIGILPGPMRKPDGITRSLRSPSDYRGASIGMNASAVADQALRALGATPIESAFRGADISAFDGIEQQVASVAGNLYDGVVRTITENVNLWPRPLVVFASTAAMRRLSDQQVSWLHAAARGSIAATATAQMRGDTDSAAQMCRRGKVGFITATPAQVAELRSAFAPTNTWLRQDKPTAHFLDQIAALQAGGITRFPSESLKCAGPPVTAAPGSASPATALDGTYRMVTTEQDGQKSDPNVPPENWGTFVYVFDRGRFAFTQENATACTWGYGTYTVTGSQTEWIFTDGGGIAPTPAANKPGEDFKFNWSIYRDTVHLTAVPGAISPDNFFLRRWHRLSTKAALSYLSTRCLPPAGALPN
jgi:TRAP-type transport system periplasmic protein